uniref:Putative secreted protein n=1 Tax=Anopheles darlingi TaxID=43151 RepID=A0A2M4D6F8_ANODA
MLSLLGCSLSLFLSLSPEALVSFSFFFAVFPSPTIRLPSAIKSLFDARSSTPSAPSSAPPGSTHWFIRLDTKTRGAGL